MAPSSSTEMPVLTDFLPPCDQWPVQVSLEQVVELSERHQLPTIAWVFAPLLEGESLQQHVERHGLEACPGPHLKVWGGMGWRCVGATLTGMSWRCVTDRRYEAAWHHVILHASEQKVLMLSRLWSGCRQTLDGASPERGEIFCCPSCCIDYRSLSTVERQLLLCAYGFPFPQGTVKYASPKAVRNLGLTSLEGLDDYSKVTAFRLEWKVRNVLVL